MNLRAVFPVVAAKVLVAVDLPDYGSNQHEINGVTGLKEFFGEEKTSESIQWVYFRDNHEPSHDAGTVTFYDARARSSDRTGRSEWRLYYQGQSRL
jgi:hypothetical protein